MDSWKCKIARNFSASRDKPEVTLEMISWLEEGVMSIECKWSWSC